MSGIRVRVWDLPTRIFHWALVVLIAALWWTGRSDDIATHKFVGFAVIALIVFRLYWGIAGSETARFSNFLRGPRGVWRYLRGRARPSPGHTPLGALSVVALLGLVAAESVLGLFAIDEDGLDSGPFATAAGFDWARAAAHWHAALFDGLVALIALHVGAVLVYWLAGQNLLIPMLTGRKRMGEGTVPPKFAGTLSLLAGVVLAAAAFGVLWRLDK